MGLGNLVQKAVYIGIGAASYAGEKASDSLTALSGQLQKLTDEMVERGEMTTEEARRYVDEKMKMAQQEFAGAASYAGGKAGNNLIELGERLQKLADEMVERGEMTPDEARRYVDEKIKMAQQESGEPRRIEIVDEDEAPPSQPNPVSPTPQHPEKPESEKPQISTDPVEDMRRQVAELQEELKRLRS